MNQSEKIIMRIAPTIVVFCTLIACSTPTPSSSEEENKGDAPVAKDENKVATETATVPIFTAKKTCPDGQPTSYTIKKIGIEIVPPTTPNQSNGFVVIHPYIINFGRNNEEQKYFLVKDAEGYSPSCLPGDGERKPATFILKLTGGDNLKSSFQPPSIDVSTTLEMLIRKPIEELFRRENMPEATWELCDQDNKQRIFASTTSKEGTQRTEPSIESPTRHQLSKVLDMLDKEFVKRWIKASEGCEWTESTSGESKLGLAVECKSKSSPQLIIPGFANPISISSTGIDNEEVTIYFKQSYYSSPDNGGNKDISGKIGLSLSLKDATALSCFSQKDEQGLNCRLCFDQKITLDKVISSQQNPLEIKKLDCSNSETNSGENTPPTASVEASAGESRDLAPQGQQKMVLISLSNELDSRNSTIHKGLTQFFSSQFAKSKVSLWVIEAGRKLVKILDPGRLPTEENTHVTIEKLSFSADDLNAMDDLELVDDLLRENHRLNTTVEQRIGKILYLTDNSRIGEGKTAIPSRLLGMPGVWQGLYGVKLKVLTTGSCEPWQQAKAECQEWGKSPETGDLEAQFEQFLNK